MIIIIIRTSESIVGVIISTDFRGIATATVACAVRMRVYIHTVGDVVFVWVYTLQHVVHHATK